MSTLPLNGQDLEESLREMLDGVQQLEGKLTERIEHLLKHQDEQDDAPFQSVVAQELRAQVRSCRLKHQVHNLRYTFTKFSKNQQGIEENEFWSALSEVKSGVLDRSEADELFRKYDKQRKGYLDLDEFYSAIETAGPSEILFGGIGLQRLVASALPQKAGKSTAEVLRGLKRFEIKAVVQAVAGELEEILCEHVEQQKTNTGEHPPSFIPTDAQCTHRPPRLAGIALS
jgi:hypothetical protein